MNPQPKHRETKPCAHFMKYTTHIFTCLVYSHYKPTDKHPFHINQSGTISYAFINKR